ncbi:MAG: PDZ domain-containing protein [Bacillota bacterium]|nr:PDZ domain-containing protein [Bacillota bacterium]
MGELSEFLQGLSDDLKHPVVLEPPLKKDLLARVEGVIRSSPAEHAGLKKGDIITTVDGKKVISGVEAFFQIQKALDPLLEVRRSEKDAENFLDKSITIKLSKKGGEPSGVVFSYDLEADSVSRVNTRARNRRSPFLLTSRAAAPLWEAAKRELLLPRELCISIVENGFFGGSICCAGLLTVSDFEKNLQKLLKLEVIPDLVIVPLKPFDGKGFDLRGDHFQKLPAAFPQLSFSFL